MKRIYAFGVILFPAMMMFGCHSNNQTALSPLFAPDKDKAQIDAFANAQAAAAAHQDSSLFGADFTGDHLNSLGTARLDSICSGCERSSMMEIYLADVADTPEHRSAITSYLIHHHGCKSDQFAVVGGSNPNSYTMAGQNIKDLDALAGASPTAAADSSMGSGGLGGAAGSK